MFFFIVLAPGGQPYGPGLFTVSKLADAENYGKYDKGDLKITYNLI